MPNDRAAVTETPSGKSLVRCCRLRTESGSFPIPPPRRILEQGYMDANDTQTDAGRSRHLTRLPREGFLGGVAAGVAEYLDIDVAIARLAFVALSFFAGIAIPLYIAGWLLIPEEGTDIAIADEILQHARLR